MQRTGLKRGGKGNEKYYTKPEVVNKCLEEFKKLNIDKTTDVVIEPSAGNGSFTTRLVYVFCPSILQTIYRKSSATTGDAERSRVVRRSVSFILLSVLMTPI